MHFLSYGTLSCNSSFRFELQTLFWFCGCKCTSFMSLCCAILASDFKLQTLFFFCCCKCTFFLMALCHAIPALGFRLQTLFFLLVEISVPFCQAWIAILLSLVANWKFLCKWDIAWCKNLWWLFVGFCSSKHLLSQISSSFSSGTQRYNSSNIWRNWAREQRDWSHS